jgi:alpha-N-acetylglucosaminidase
MIQVISKNNKVYDLNLASRYKDYSLDAIFPNYAFDCIKIWINDDDKFNELKNLLTFKIDKSLTNIQIIPENNKFTISAENLHNLLFGFGYYVREIAHGHIGWCVERVPSEWIIPTNTITINPNFKYRMAYNYCTLSYTMAFWDETLWEREIIRLAMLGFNMALVIAGMPKIWQLVLNELNQSNTLIKKFIPDEAAQAWWAMGNLQQNDGVELDDDRINKDADLARFIVKKMRMVGIEPVF